MSADVIFMYNLTRSGDFDRTVCDFGQHCLLLQANMVHSVRSCKFKQTVTTAYTVLIEACSRC